MSTSPVPVLYRTHYDHALRRVPGWWRGAVALVVVVVAFFLFSLVIGGLAIVFDVFVTGAISLEDFESGVIPITPVQLLATNVALALMIPVAMGLQRLLFGVPVRFLHSVTGRFRWQWFGRLAAVIVPLWVLYVGATFLLAPEGSFRVDGTAIALVFVVLLTTPLQAAGEEYAMRGIAQRSISSWIPSPRLALAVSTAGSAVLFGLAHFAGDPWLIAYYVLFGAAMSIAVWGSGGIEAAVLIHATNNVLIFLGAAFTGALEQGIDRSAGTGGPIVLVPIFMVLLAAVVTTWLARRQGVERVAPQPLTVAEERARQQAYDLAAQHYWASQGQPQYAGVAQPTSGATAQQQGTAAAVQQPDARSTMPVADAAAGAHPVPPPPAAVPHAPAAPDAVQPPAPPFGQTPVQPPAAPEDHRGDEGERSAG
ncbi:CPBP family intramembrane glutamic endopeptidase [Herbiconiux sp. SYSU D00978]|uniref:CPBP family intramembrane glutamic endopeptidase n=1 Tax=Herbiconiux sp. SYSU D00978 TaxID=2812562 RepID=UPI001A9754E1|nr:type II CAAX endopeptidase family protein [Herbiconiux sp. SYSU D00978]